MFAQNLGCLAAVEAASGNVGSIMVAGGIGDGTVYQSNYGNNDVSTAIDAYVDIELDARGLEFWLNEIVLRLKDSEGGCTITPYLSDVAQTAITVPTTSERTRERPNIKSFHTKIRIQNNNAGESLYLYDLGLVAYTTENR